MNALQFFKLQVSKIEAQITYTFNMFVDTHCNERHEISLPLMSQHNALLAKRDHLNNIIKELAQ